MKKTVKDLIKFLEKETTISFDLSRVSPEREIRNQYNEPFHIIIIDINNGSLGLAISTCACNKCNRIIQLNVIYDGDNLLISAKKVQNQLLKVLQKIPVEINKCK